MTTENPGHLVSADWLAARLGEPDLCVFDSTVHLQPATGKGYDVMPGRADFERAHIPGARFVDLQADLSDPGHRFRFMLPGSERFAAELRRLGVNERSRVVFYSTANPWWAARGWWLLHIHGFPGSVLDGGLQAWQREGRPVESGPSAVVAEGDFAERAPLPRMVDRDAVLRAMQDGSAVLVNALRPEQHAGSGGVAYGRPGRIAGSINVPAMALVDPETNLLLPPARMREIFAKAGVGGRKVIAYCGGGIAATEVALALTLLGHEDVSVYDASLSEWSIDPALPMETG